MKMMDARKLNPNPRNKEKRLFKDKGPLAEKLPKATILEWLPGGNLGEFGLVCKGIVKGMEKPVALKISKSSGIERRRLWEEELEKSIRISKLIPNVASYYGMVDVKGNSKFPAFAMEIVVGYPVFDSNLDCIDAGRLRRVLNRNAVDQLANSLEIAACHKWYAQDMQYFILLQDQTLNGKNYMKGDLILFDFCDWQKKKEDSRLYYRARVERLRKWMENMDNPVQKIENIG